MAADGFIEIERGVIQYERAKTEIDEAWQAYKEFMNWFVLYWNRNEAGQLWAR